MLCQPVSLCVGHFSRRFQILMFIFEFLYDSAMTPQWNTKEFAEIIVVLPSKGVTERSLLPFPLNQRWSFDTWQTKHRNELCVD